MNGLNHVFVNTDYVNMLGKILLSMKKSTEILQVSKEIDLEVNIEEKNQTYEHAMKPQLVRKL